MSFRFYRISVFALVLFVLLSILVPCALANTNADTADIKQTKSSEPVTPTSTNENQGGMSEALTRR